MNEHESSDGHDGPRGAVPATIDEAGLAELLERAAADVPVTAVPARVLATAPARRGPTRRWLTTAGAGLAAAAVVVGVVLVLPEGGADGGGTAPDVVASGGPSAPDGGGGTVDPQAPPPGTTYVGSGRVVVAVPTGWAKDDTYCGEPQSDTYSVQDDWPVEQCLAAPTRFSSLTVAPDDGRGLPWDDVGLSPAEQGGTTVDRSEVTCRTSRPASCTGYAFVPSERIGVTVEAQDRAEVDRLLDSVALLDDGWVTVPETIASWGDADEPRDALVDDLTGLGLVPEVEPAPGRSDAIRSIDPGPGTPVRVGSTVVLRPELAGPA